jgi:hypothetical protein
MQTEGLDPAWVKERDRLRLWVDELRYVNEVLKASILTRNYKLKRECMAWFNEQGVDSLGGY